MHCRGDEESWTFVLALLLLPKPANLSYAAYLSQPDHGYNFLVTMVRLGQIRCIAEIGMAMPTAPLCLWQPPQQPACMQASRQKAG